MKIKIVSWNVNGIRAVLKKGEFETFKSAPTNNTNEGEKFAKVGNLTAKQEWLKYNKNK